MGAGVSTPEAPLLLQWHYLIFLLPLGAAALLLALTSLRMGGHGSAHGHAGGHTGHMGGHAASHGGHPTHAHHPTAGRRTIASGSAASQRSLMDVVAFVTGWGRAPLPLVAGVFCLAWGFAGFWTNRTLLPDGAAPTFGRMLVSLGIALAAGLVSARVATEAFARLAPTESSAAISRDALFGLTGRVTFPANEMSGRIRVYDEFGTLHDEPCRVADGQPQLPKGAQAIVADRDTQGRLIIEQTSA